MPYSWPSEVLDLTQMVMDVWKQLKITVFIIPYNFCFINISKKAFLGLLLVWSQTLEARPLDLTQMVMDILLLSWAHQWSKSFLLTP